MRSSRNRPKNFGTVCGVTMVACAQASVGLCGIGPPVIPHTNFIVCATLRVSFVRAAPPLR